MEVINNEKLFEALKELGVIKESALEETLQDSLTQKIYLGDLLLAKDLITEENLAQVTSDLLSVPLAHLSSVYIKPEILRIIPEVVAKKQKIISFDKDKNGLKLAMIDPTNTEITHFLEKKVGDKVVPYLATKREINNALSLYKKDLEKTFEEMLQEQVNVAGKTTSFEAPIAKIIDLLLEYAYSNKASDVHLEPREDSSVVRFRIDGVLHDVLDIPESLHNQLISRIKVISQLRTDEHLSAQDGKLQIKLEEENLDVRVSIVPIVEGEKVVLRLLSSQSRRFTLSDLGIPEGDLEKVKGGFDRSFGMILATGPTGCGKTTTIYSILKVINTRERNIATIEDPVEYDIEGVNQIQVNPKTNLTFADGLRAILRQDPDVIFVGEIRDKETASIAINSSMTGHLVLSTLHTNNAATTLPRLTDMGVEPFLVASTVNMIVGQRLVRKICENCRHSKTINLKEIAKGLPSELIKKHFGGEKEAAFYEGKGCDVCHGTGYVGRLGIFEVMIIDDAIRKLILSKSDAKVIEQKAIDEGMSTMLEDGLKKAIVGLTTIEEVIKTTKT